MLKKNIFALCLMIITCGAAQAFDLEDYATTYRATRDAYLKATNELKLATGPYKAAQDAYFAGTLKYQESLESPDKIRLAREKAENMKKCLSDYKTLKDEYDSKFKPDNNNN